MKIPDCLLFKFSTNPEKSVRISQFMAYQISQISTVSATGSHSSCARISIINLSVAHPLQLSKKAKSMKRYLNRSPLKYKGRHDFSNQRRDQSAPLLSLELREGENGGSICGGWILIYTMIVTRIQKRRQDMPADHLSELHSAISKTTPFEDTPAPKTLIL